MIQLPGSVAAIKKRGFKEFFLTIPFEIRRYVILPILCITLLFTVGVVLRLSWKFGGDAYQKIRVMHVAMSTNLVYRALILLGIGVLWFLIRWARRHNYLKASFSKIVRIIAVILLAWIIWKLFLKIVYLFAYWSLVYQRIQDDSEILRATYACIAFMPLCAIIFLWWAYRRNHPLPGTWYERQKASWWWRENEFCILVGIIAFHWDIFTVWPDWWMKHVGEDHRIWALHAILIAFAWLIPKGTIPFHHKLGRLGVVLAIASMVIVFVWNPGQPGSTPTVANLPELPLPTNADPEVVEAVKSLKLTQPDLYAVAIPESNLNQWEIGTDGKPDHTKPLHARLKGGGFGSATGIFQIKFDLHDAYCRPLGADINTIDGNVKCAKLLYAREGLGPWARTGDLVYDIVVDKDNPVVRIKRPNLRDGLRFDFDEEALLIAGGKTYKLGSKAEPFVVPADVQEYEFRSVDGKKSTGRMVYHFGTT